MSNHRPLSLTVAAVVMALEGVTALLLGGYVGVETVIGKPDDVVSSIFVAGFGILVGVALLWVAVGMLRTERWARSPGVLTQIFAVVVGVTLIQSDQRAIGIPLIAAAVIGLVALLSPPTTDALYGDHQDSL
ncbi:hypothetical protein [Streptosporangium carneum]|uniref:Integral membrane protein n=1 Tax=Streptosporangium carneum TaxID=47481 RepID=A0A9W6MIQ3_9ACTN|nr:hypothetical protein [Streptosporangium carneum]GLK15445.1 hypothetical protein GCM10017600_88580 [Streptosporangium carneum]